MPSDASSIPRVAPLLTEQNTFFWTSGEEGVLRFLRCGNCGFYVHPPAPVCARCHSLDVAPQAVSGEGTVLSYTVNHHAFGPGGSGGAYVIGLVELDEQEGLRLTTNLVHVDTSDVEIGMRVRVVFEPFDDVWLPLFEPVG